MARILMQEVGMSSRSSSIEAIKTMVKYVRPELAPEDRRQLQGQMEWLLLEGPQES